MSGPLGPPTSGPQPHGEQRHIVARRVGQPGPPRGSRGGRPGRCPRRRAGRVLRGGWGAGPLCRGVDIRAAPSPPEVNRRVRCRHGRSLRDGPAAGHAGVAPRPGIVLLAVDGEIDTLTAARLQAGLDEAVDAARADGSGVVVDLSGVTFLASSGLAVLIGGSPAPGRARRPAAPGRRLPRRHAPVAGAPGADALFDILDDVASAARRRRDAPPPGVAPPPGEVGR